MTITPEELRELAAFDLNPADVQTPLWPMIAKDALRQAAYQSFEATLRDRFAMAVLPTLVMDTKATAKTMAQAAYDIADAMMKAREGK